MIFRNTAALKSSKNRVYFAKMRLYRWNSAIILSSMLSKFFAISNRFIKSCSMSMIIIFGLSKHHIFFTLSSLNSNSNPVDSDFQFGLGISSACCRLIVLGLLPIYLELEGDCGTVFTDDLTADDDDWMFSLFFWLLSGAFFFIFFATVSDCRYFETKNQTNIYASFVNYLKQIMMIPCV